jgi:glyoxylate/hydroxypyruvate reductase A
MQVAVWVPSAENCHRWVALLQTRLEGWRVSSFDEVRDLQAVDFAVVWKPRPGATAQFENLRAIVSIGAGIDHVLADPLRPVHVPVIRTVGPNLTQMMREYVALHVLRHHRDMPAVLAAQRAREWSAVSSPVAGARRVGVMGLGNLGQAAAQTLVQLGFDVAGWSRRPKTIDGVRSFAGQAGFPEFLRSCDILVNLLPLTDETRNILNADLFVALPQGACLINCARGEHLVEQDLLDALETGAIRQATLDVFVQEPLPHDHPFWTHPGVTVTPHSASRISPEMGADLIAENLQAFAETGTCDSVTDCTRGY